ncbi:MAG: hypothetical protein PVG89_07735 [Gammaproteobacteria bacterium]|jgi:hypothetical protein
MSIAIYAGLCAFITAATLLLIYGIFAIWRKNGKSDTRHSRIALVIASFLLPIVVTTFFVLAAVTAQALYQFQVPVGQRGGGVFVVLIASVAAAILTLVILLPRIRRP